MGISPQWLAESRRQVPLPNGRMELQTLQLNYHPQNPLSSLPATIEPTPGVLSNAGENVRTYRQKSGTKQTLFLSPKSQVFRTVFAQKGGLGEVK